MLLLADDNAATRSALQLVISTCLNNQVVQVAEDWERMLALAERTYPEIILLDWELPGLPSGQAIPCLRSILPDGVIIALSARPEARREALTAGVDAFIAKSEPPDRVIDTIRRYIPNVQV